MRMGFACYFVWVSAQGAVGDARSTILSTILYCRWCEYCTTAGGHIGEVLGRMADISFTLTLMNARGECE